jgi:hypothetical protein
MANWKRCRVAMTITARGLDRAEHLWPGLVVNLERELTPGFTVGDAVAGRESDFEAAPDPTRPEPALADEAAVSKARPAREGK